MVPQLALGDRVSPTYRFSIPTFLWTMKSQTSIQVPQLPGTGEGSQSLTRARDGLPEPPQVFPGAGDEDTGPT